MLEPGKALGRPGEKAVGSDVSEGATSTEGTVNVTLQLKHRSAYYRIGAIPFKFEIM
jgi:hypothetical protein